MFTTFFYELRRARVPVSLKEYLALLEAMKAGVAEGSVDDFYHLARTVLVKDERNFDRFDVVFGHVFKGMDTLGAVLEEVFGSVPEEWLRKLAERVLTAEEKAQIAALGSWDAIMRTLAERLREQQGRHQGGSKWIGTAGTSPFGAHGYNPEGVRIGQDGNRNRRAVKVWDRRDFRNLDDTVEIGTRNIKVALRRLRRFARTGAAEELDLPDTIRSTAENAGWLDIKMRPERRNTAKVLLFLDVGGSMDDHVRVAEELFSAARSEFRHLEHFYFHNCIYEGVWRDNRRRADAMPTWDLLRTYGPDYRVVFVGDASMSPYEIVQPGGAVEHWNAEAGQVWLERMLANWPRAVWLNPVAQSYWGYTQSIALVRKIMEDRMFPLTLDGLDGAMRALMR
jgi:uncharacterized protein